MPYHSSKSTTKQTDASKKKPLQYAIVPCFEQEIREYINGVHDNTGLPKSRIATNLLMEAITERKKNLPIQLGN